jgi:hypothetical protein
MNEQHSDEQIIAALHETMGKVCLASERLGCLPETIYERARVVPAVRGAIRFFLKGEAWAVRLALIDWGLSRGFSDGAEAWHAPQSDQDLPPGLVQKVAFKVLNDHDFFEGRHTCCLGIDSRAVCRNGQPGPVENGAAPGGDRPGDRGDDSREDRADSAD